MTRLRAVYEQSLFFLSPGRRTKRARMRTRVTEVGWGFEPKAHQNAKSRVCVSYIRFQKSGRCHKRRIFGRRIFEQDEDVLRALI